MVDVPSKSGQVPGGGRLGLHGHRQLPVKAFCASAFRPGRLCALTPGAPMTVSQHSNPQRVRSRMAPSTAEGAVPAKRWCPPVRHPNSRLGYRAVENDRRPESAAKGSGTKEPRMQAEEDGNGCEQPTLSLHHTQQREPPRQALLRSSVQEAALSYASAAFK